MLIEAGGLNEHANVTQSPAVFYEAFIFSGSPPSLFAWFRLFYRPCILSGQNRIYTGRIGRIDTQHFLQVRFYPAEEDQVMGDQVMGDQVMQLRNPLGRPDPDKPEFPRRKVSSSKSEYRFSVG